jgi:hypothetical protein
VLVDGEETTIPADQTQQARLEDNAVVEEMLMLMLLPGGDRYVLLNVVVEEMTML